MMHTCARCGDTMSQEEVFFDWDIAYCSTGCMDAGMFDDPDERGDDS